MLAIPDDEYFGDATALADPATAQAVADTLKARTDALRAERDRRLPAPSVGHLGGCASYEADGGPCAVQHTSAQLEGPAMRKWSVAAVRSMSSSPRATNGAMCRDWFATTSDPF